MILHYLLLTACTALFCNDVPLPDPKPPRPPMNPNHMFRAGNTLNYIMNGVPNLPDPEKPPRPPRKSDQLFDQWMSLYDWTISDFISAIVDQATIRHQTDDKVLWITTAESQPIYISRYFTQWLSTRFALYDNPAFIAVFKTLPYAQECIYELFRDLNASKRTFDEKSVLFITKLYDYFTALEKQKSIAPYLAKEFCSDDDTDRPQLTYPLYEHAHPHMQKLWDDRYVAYELTQQNAQSTIRRYDIKDTTQNYLLDHNINPALLEHCCGNELQQQFHKEYLDIADSFTELNAYQKAGRSMLLDLMHEAVKEAAGQHYYQVAALASDYCNQATVMARGCLRSVFSDEGVDLFCQAAQKTADIFAYTGTRVLNGQIVDDVADGLLGSAQNIIYMCRHPLETATNIAHGCAMLGGIAVKTVSTMVELDYLYEHNPEEYTRRMTEINHQLCNGIKEVTKWYTQIDETKVTENVVSFAAETFILGKIPIKIPQVLKKTRVWGKVAAAVKRIPKKVAELYRRIKQSQDRRIRTALEGCPRFTEAGLICKPYTTALGSELATTAGAVNSGFNPPSLIRVIETSFQNQNKVTTLKHFFANLPEVEALIAKFSQVKLAIQHVPSCMQKGIRFTQQSIKHIFGLEVKEIFNTVSKMMKQELGGFHFNQFAAMEREGFIKIVGQKTLVGGVEEISLIFMGEQIKKTVFPSSWSVEKCCVKIIESMNNVIPEFQKGRYVYHGFTECGVKIRTIVEECGSIVSSYPVA